MSELTMSEAERQAFLADVRVGLLAVERADGPPLNVPVWYDYAPGGDVVVLIGASSLKGRLLAAAGRASLCAQQESLPYRYVTVEGPTTIEPMTQADAPEREALAIRYLGEEMGREYASGPMPADEVRVRLRPERWYSVDYGKLGAG